MKGWSGEQPDEEEQKNMALAWPDDPPPKTKASPAKARAKKGGGKRPR